MIQMFVLGVKKCLLGNYCLRHKIFLYSAGIIDLILSKELRNRAASSITLQGGQHGLTFFHFLVLSIKSHEIIQWPNKPQKNIIIQ